MKRIGYLLFVMLLLCIGNTSVYAASDVKMSSSMTVKKTKYKIYESEKGKKIYVNKGLYVRKNGKYVRVNKKTQVSKILDIFDDYIYYIGKNGYLCRIRMDGKNERKYSIKTRSIKDIYNGYIYYVSHKDNGLSRISTKNKNQSKILPYSVIFDCKRCNDKLVYYKSKIKDAEKDSPYLQYLKADVYTCDLDGNNKKKIYSFNDDCSVQIAVYKDKICLVGASDGKIEIVIVERDIDDYTCKVIKTFEQDLKEGQHPTVSMQLISFYKDGVYYTDYVEEDDLRDHVFALDFDGNINDLGQSDDTENGFIYVDNDRLVSKSRVFRRIRICDLNGKKIKTFKTQVKKNGDVCKLYRILDKKKAIKLYYKGKKHLIIRKLVKVKE